MGGANVQSQQWKPNPNDIRSDGTMKGSGFLGGMKRFDNPNDVSSEISIGVDWGSGEKQIPTMVPTLDSNEIKYLLSTPEDKIFTTNPDLYKSIETKAVKHAIKREQQGLPYFAQENESQKQKTNIMGGSNSQALKNYKKHGMELAQPDRGEGMSQETADAYARFDKKPASPNSFGRDASTVDPASVVKKKDVEMVKKPTSSYDAIDSGLGR
jgi:hypothetical protein